MSGSRSSVTRVGSRLEYHKRFGRRSDAITDSSETLHDLARKAMRGFESFLTPPKTEDRRFETEV